MDNRRLLFDEKLLFSVGRLSDLGVAAAWTIAALIVSAVPPLADTLLRAVLGFPLLVFIPGYAIAAALFPRDGDLSSGERIAISVGLSVMTAGFVGLVLAVTPIGLTMASAGPAVAAVAIGSMLIGWSRRSRLPPGES